MSLAASWKEFILLVEGKGTYDTVQRRVRAEEQMSLEDTVYYSMRISSSSGGRMLRRRLNKFSKEFWF